MERSRQVRRLWRGGGQGDERAAAGGEVASRGCWRRMRAQRGERMRFSWAPAAKEAAGSKQRMRRSASDWSDMRAFVGRGHGNAFGDGRGGVFRCIAWAGVRSEMRGDVRWFRFEE